VEGAHFVQAGVADLQHIAKFLQANDLPTVGIDKCINNFVIAVREDGAWAGVAGLEIYGEDGLLRSVAVNERFRNLGYGCNLVEEILRKAKMMGIQNVYLLTNNAEAYFRSLGFEVVERSTINEAVKRSPEFAECCETAVAMRRSIG
jgi:N-acetylglutamate synthase-like GNAT family acetyltransferase